MTNGSSLSVRTSVDVEGAASSHDAVRVAVRSAAALGLPGIFQPGLDEAGMSAIWLAMVTTIARRQGVEVSATTATKLVAAAVAGVSAYSMGSKVLTWSLILIMHALPFAVIPGAVAMNVALNALFTYKLGTTCIKRFSTPNLTVSEVIAIGRQIVMLPSLGEIREIKQMFAG